MDSSVRDEGKKKDADIGENISLFFCNLFTLCLSLGAELKTLVPKRMNSDNKFT